MRKAIGVQQRMAITLWYLATNSDFRTIAHLFGVSKATVCLVVKDVCAAIVDILLPKGRWRCLLTRKNTCLRGTCLV